MCQNTRQNFAKFLKEPHIKVAVQKKVPKIGQSDPSTGKRNARRSHEAATRNCIKKIPETPDSVKIVQIPLENAQKTQFH